MFQTSEKLPSSSRIGCPTLPEDVAEEYALGRLHPLAAQAFEEHYLGCPLCAWVTRDTLRFIEAFREIEPHSHLRVTARSRRIEH